MNFRIEYGVAVHDIARILSRNVAVDKEARL
ncbi:hypothetical protein T472_0215775 [Youngiibacter fragilis 232.1]|uniref:Uncharacterized protein n=1 Tax=Youngiibacter fragilis 232.1 TaxID=994573 RepID=V7I368_9CLOT|nr:hypothetical protein T472_0215775 [Youngiibacter fragilis 232.1]